MTINTDTKTKPKSDTDFFVNSLAPLHAASDRPAGPDHPDLEEAPLSDAAKALIMVMLVDAYTDPIEATIREIIINAIDAHAVVGQRAPVVVTVPTIANPTFTVTDRGVGMSLIQLKSNFAGFVDSLKVGERTTVGTFGIGAKAPYGVAQQFTVTTSQSGHTVTALFYLSSNDVPANRVISNTFTGEPDGTTLEIPVDPKEIRTWRDRIDRVMEYITPGLVQLMAISPAVEDMPQGKQPPARPGPWAVPTRLTARDWIRSDLSTTCIGWLKEHMRREHFGSQTRHVVMGNIGYLLPKTLAKRYPQQVIFFAPDNSLQVTHTRETIKDTEHNTRVLDHLYQQWMEDKLGGPLKRLAGMTTMLDKMMEIERAARQFDSLASHIVKDVLTSSNVGPVRRLRPINDRGTSSSDIPLELYNLVYRPGVERQWGHHLGAPDLAQLLIKAEATASGDDVITPVIVLDAGAPENLHDRKLMSRVTAAVRQARTLENMARLHVVVTSGQLLQELSAQFDEAEMAWYLQYTSEPGWVDSGSKKDAPPLPLVDTATLPWMDLADFLTAHRPVRTPR